MGCRSAHRGQHGANRGPSEKLNRPMRNGPGVEWSDGDKMAGEERDGRANNGLNGTGMPPQSPQRLSSPCKVRSQPSPINRPSDTDLIVRPRYGTLPRTTSGHVPHAHTARQRYIQHNFYTAYLIPRTVLYSNCTLLRWCGGITPAYFAAYSLLHLLIAAAYSGKRAYLRLIGAYR